MANSEIGTSTSNTLGGEYHVFLSFRGSDTHCSFTDILHQALVDARIRVFINDKGLRPNERISDNLLQVIDNSKLYIPIFSKDYASSYWCLDELVKMVENSSKHKEDGKEKVILPIFYNVKPDDVKLKTALYNNAILNLEQTMEDQEHKFSSEDIKTWRQALIEVGRMKGREVENDTSHAELIEAVVDEVMARLWTRQRPVTRKLFGMENRIADIETLLDIDPGCVWLIGIYGISGIGKTTLAKIIFDQRCPQYGKNCIFLDDVRETVKSGGLVVLQKKLSSFISKEAHKIDDIEGGINTIEETICNKKMLIVLDDVDEADQIQNLIGEKFLYPGTRIIVTTRDKNVLIRNSKYNIEAYEMKRLSDEHALKLFSRHAFNDDSPPANYCTLSKGIVYTTYGLPLALQAIGSALFQEKKGIWEEWIEKLKETPHEDVLAKLRICYDALKPNEQEIFLDIACFLVGENKTNPMYVWQDCKFNPENAIQVLINRCMIKELDDNNLWMHDHFRDIGRAIAKKDRTRLWDKDNIIRELRSMEIKESVQALCLKSRDLSEPPRTVTSEQIRRFTIMRTLLLCKVVCKGDFAGCLSKLKWISLDYGHAIPSRPAALCHQWFEATNLLHLEDAVVVNLSGVDITEDVFKSLIQGPRKLKVLTLCYNTSIHGTPTFPQNSSLEKLTISNFFFLKEVDCSIGKLTKLIDLSFELCLELEKLPEQIGELRKLQQLSLRSCNSLWELPDSILKLTSLTKLDVLGTRITRLPDSIDRLSILSSINVSFTSIEKLPNTISKLLCLQTLHLNNCDQIQELPELPRSLTTLRLTSTSLVTVPNLSYLTNLVELALSDGSESMAKSYIFQTCDLQWFGSLSRLSKLQFCFSNVCVSTVELGSLSLLEELTLHGLDVPAFKQLPPKLIVLELCDTRGKQIRPLRLKKKTTSVSSSSRELGENKVLRQNEFIEDRKSLEGSVHLRKKPECNELQAPEVIDHWKGGFYFPRYLNMLRKFVLWGCPGVEDIEFVSTLKSLLVFSVGGCTSLKRLGSLSNLKHLMELTLNRCWSLQVVEGVGELEFLHQLKIDLCGSVERIFDPLSSKIPNMCSISIRRSGKLPDCGRTLYTWESYKEKIFRSEDIISFPIVPHLKSNSIFGLKESETSESTKQKGKRKFDCYS